MAKKKWNPIKELQIQMGIEAKARGMTLKEYERSLKGKQTKNLFKFPKMKMPKMKMGRRKKINVLGIKL